MPALPALAGVWLSSNSNITRAIKPEAKRETSPLIASAMTAMYNSTKAFLLQWVWQPESCSKMTRRRISVSTVPDSGEDVNRVSNGYKEIRLKVYGLIFILLTNKKQVKNNKYYSCFTIKDRSV